MKKLLTLFTLALLGIGSAWADTEESGNTGSNNTAINGKSYSLDGKYIAGKGGVQQGNMPDKGVKLRSNQGNLVFEVNAGYEITAFNFYCAGNTSTTVDITSVTVDGGENQIASTLTIPAKGGSTSCDIKLSGISAKNNITITFKEGSSAQIVGTWDVTYVQNEVIIQNIESVTLNGSAISDTDLATLKSDKAVTIDGSSLNGLGTVDVTLSSGATTVTRTVTDGNAKYEFTINTSEKYTITVTGAAKTYAAAQGLVVAYDNQTTEKNGNVVTANGITLEYPTKSFQYGTGRVTLGSTSYQPLKLSTGEAFTVTLPEGKVATKLIVYGWSQNGNGALVTIKETAESEDKVLDDAKDNIFYATNTAADVYPSMYEYDLDDWKSFYMSAGGSASQPFIVLDFVLEDAAATVDMTITSAGWATFSSTNEVAIPTGVTAYIAKEKDASTVTLSPISDYVPANTGVVIAGAEGTYAANITSTGATAPADNLLKAWTAAGTPDDAEYYTLAVDGSDPVFKKSSGGTLAAGKAYLVLPGAGARLSVVLEGSETTGINAMEAVKANSGETYNLQGQRVAAPQKGLYIVNGKKVILK